MTTLGEASSAVAEVYPDGSAWFGGYFQIGGEPGTQLAQLSVSTTDTDKPSVLIQGAASQYGPLLQILDALGAVDFRVEADGNIASSKIEFVGGTLGNVIARLPISSPGAGVIGYIPIYDDIE